MAPIDLVSCLSKRFRVTVEGVIGVTSSITRKKFQPILMLLPVVPVEIDREAIYNDLAAMPAGLLWSNAPCFFGSGILRSPNAAIAEQRASALLPKNA